MGLKIHEYFSVVLGKLKWSSKARVCEPETSKNVYPGPLMNLTHICLMGYLMAGLVELQVNQHYYLLM